MDIGFWDGVLRGGTMVLLALLAWNFAKGWRASLTARLGVLLCVAGLGYLYLPALPAAYNLAWWRVPLHLAGMASPGLFWLFAQSWFDDEFQLRPWHVLAVAGLVVAGAISSYLFVNGGLSRLALILMWPLPNAIFTALGVAAALRGRDNDLVELRRRLRLVLALTIGLAILLIVGAELFAPGWPPAGGWRLINSASLLSVTVMVALVAFGWRDPSLLMAAARPPVGAAAPPEADDSQLLARLAALMNQERLYRQDGLTITAVAARLGVPEYRLRRAINQGLGARNFNAWLNEFRIAEAKAALADPTQREVPILTIALDAGFGSLAPFNRAFRADAGCTPTEYRVNMRAD